MFLQEERGWIECSCMKGLMDMSIHTMSLSTKSNNEKPIKLHQKHQIVASKI